MVLNNTRLTSEPKKKNEKEKKKSRNFDTYDQQYASFRGFDRMGLETLSHI